MLISFVHLPKILFEWSSRPLSGRKYFLNGHEPRLLVENTSCRKIDPTWSKNQSAIKASPENGSDTKAFHSRNVMECVPIALKWKTSQPHPSLALWTLRRLHWGRQKCQRAGMPLHCLTAPRLFNVPCAFESHKKMGTARLMSLVSGLLSQPPLSSCHQRCSPTQ